MTSGKVPRNTKPIRPKKFSYSLICASNGIQEILGKNRKAEKIPSILLICLSKIKERNHEKRKDNINVTTEIINACIMKHKEEVGGFHKLRTRRAGNQNYIDFHMVMAKDISLEQAHQVCDQIEHEMHNCLNGASVTIHVEPCNGECEHCLATCSNRKPK